MGESWEQFQNELAPKSFLRFPLVPVTSSLFSSTNDSNRSSFKFVTAVSRLLHRAISNLDLVSAADRQLLSTIIHHYHPSGNA